MSKTLFHSAKNRTSALLGFVICVLAFCSTRQASASGFGVSLNLGGTSITFGVGDTKSAPPAPAVVVQEPAFVPPDAVAPKPEPRPRYVRRFDLPPVPMKQVDVPTHKQYA